MRYNGTFIWKIELCYIIFEPNKTITMSQEDNKTNTKNQWILFAVSTLALIAMLIYVPTFFWVVLPIQLTSFVMAMRWI